MRCPVEKLEGRVTDMRKAGALMRAAITVLLLPVALSSALAVSVYLHIESVLHFALPLVAACAVLAALGVGLVAYALHHLGHGEYRTARTADKNDCFTGRYTG